ncbi:MAG: UDP-N-acetylglucosamine--N-acetylmuramyl-(pentapeptide) pyrophosphoryl-undecaprenol N-acetylglucosamine transferase [Candidatus Calescibacterium sp.]|nr:UDP-N-acetylglucosamine--N-acetylmuramyl-(pentapeptide) pyrophosphoryl-undecaprenol N-acetylglucosamine transferase [Candidatus Calescibacterium sp.]MCX7733185.1 UDP-N-acetylglucosamine--N-acetylmuramyl-(pentapeptide) pyrophosphoryl-undecaprenol N-acetylglucosamine transferase [bacterium]MDW8086892.1 UDP-N-acetylglucosamine--N-acetylmuramyl-(pentapeptide) pyrophosphoryl-undecaprenol N-acetylglucosamine transferase [Candidatus Calescibacterium sp.]
MRICLVAGGTGGHIAPAVAVLEKIKEDKFFITSKTRISEKRFIKDLEEKNLEFINVKPIVGKGLRSISGFFSAVSALQESFRILKKINPDIVIGFGGYVSGPVCLAGRILKKKVYIHEQNSVMGFTNKILSLFCDKIFVSFDKTEAPSYAQRKFVYTGFPLRNKFKEDLERGIDAKQSQNSYKICVFVSGGSQGAVGLNKIFVEAIERIEKNLNDLKSKLKIIHQTGDMFFEKARDFFSSWDANVFPFTDEFGFYLGLSDIAIARGGAGTVFEIAYARKPALFVPLPRSAGNHQEKNPKYLLGDACFIIRQNEKHKFEINFYDLLTNEKLRQELESKLRNIQVEDGSFRILGFIRESG